MPPFDYHKPIIVSYAEAEKAIDDAWLLQFRGSGLISDWIRMISGGAPHSHSAMTKINSRGLVDVMEIREFVGGRIRSLKWHAKYYKGRIDCFSPNHAHCWEDCWDPLGAAEKMHDLVNCKYGYRSALRIGLRHLPFVWRMFPVETDDMKVQVNGDSFLGVRPFCSHAVALAYREGGNVDVVPRLPDYLVTPSDLTHSMFFEYRFSL